MILTSHKVAGVAFSLVAAGGLGGVAYSAATNEGHIKLFGETTKDLEVPVVTLTSEGMQSDQALPRAEHEDPLGLSPEETREEDERVRQAEANRTTYTFFFKGNSGAKESISCPEGLKPDFDTGGSGKVFITCRQEGSDQTFHSGGDLGSGNKLTCTYQKNSKGFECSNEKTKRYKFGEKDSEQNLIYIVEA
ncbi:hypothetical protein MHLP_01175 [Candidatus Mycoplasma haematolamae str. Purdue]|uniref:Uncharacterized protein n=1 Tax=Mycoplasma haematolamae (strain Purdue) TaxID=1212765 RepID=I7B967_MYCHA|nr:hypothetical protein [Candidatus Mycoplasma haematolamae]AFO51815.1 hypothetical protein MHLP_01175 [Candidatus Mycoplasma haematolamae str. Purdue]